METFASGFAQGFIRARERSEDRAAEKENTMFKYKMDNLMQMKEKRIKKKAQEDEWTRQSTDLAAQMGDPEFAPVAHQELKNGVGYEAMQKRIQEGAYNQNSNYKAPTQTIKVPMAVTAPQGTAAPMEQGDTSSTYVDPQVSAPNSKKAGTGFQLPAFGKEARNKRMEDKVNKRIDEIDPELRQITELEDDDRTSTETGNSKYLYSPKNKIEFGDYDETIYKLDKAVAEGDPVKIKEYKLQVQAHERAMTRKAQINARSEGKDAKTYYRLDENGNLANQFAGVYEDGTLYNINRRNGDSRGEVVTGDVVAMDEYQVKRLDTLRDKFGEKKAAYDVSKQAFVTAVDTVNRIDDVFRMNKNAATGTASLSSAVLNMGQEFQAIGQVIAGTDAQIQEKLASGNMDGIEVLVKNQAEAVNELYGKSILNNGVIKDQATAQLLFTSLKKSAAYQFAMASTNKDKQSNQDWENVMSQIEGEGGFFAKNKRPDEIMKALNSLAETSWASLRTKQADLDNNSEVAAFERDNGLKKGASNLRADRAGDYIDTLPWPALQKQRAKERINSYDAKYETGKVRASVTGSQAPIGEQKNTPPSNEGRTATGKDGKKLILRNGKWEPLD